MKVVNVFEPGRFEEYLYGFYSRELKTYFINKATKTGKVILLVS